MRWASVLLTIPLMAQSPARSLNPIVRKAVEDISTEKVAASMRKLESFETRGNFSQTDHPTRGIGAARRWIFEQFQAASPRLQVRLDTYKVKKQPRIFRDVEVVNVVAVLPGTTHPGRQVLISAHYDSINQPPPATPAGETPPELTGEEQEKRAMAPAPGVSDDASGVAAVLEIARVLSQHEFEKTMVFVVFAGEELGLIGSTLHTQKAKEQKIAIEAVLNSDIIGTEVSGDGRRINRAVRIFSDDPNDSPSRQLARYIKDVGDRYFPRLEPMLIFRADRVARGGDHTAFAREGFPAVRFTSAVEHYTHQHSATDTMMNASPEYAANVARLKAAVAAGLAQAPNSPVTMRESTRYGQTSTLATISRGSSGYDAELRWKDPEPASDLAGYAIVMRNSLSPFWEKEIFVGKETAHTIPGVDIDNNLFGVKAIDLQGNESIVASFSARSSFAERRKIETYE
ncbi:MAG TPA: M20/M25/M40 family metallo-hydrolase [Bryobacteraceae bacterium]|nr:M20/M25/M40 family metallo-hydrolase [Bryobacteraceae bacterium]